MFISGTQIHNPSTQEQLQLTNLNLVIYKHNKIMYISKQQIFVFNFFIFWGNLYDLKLFDEGCLNYCQYNQAGRKQSTQN